MLKLVLALAILLYLAASPAFARPEYAQREKKPCSYCHVDPKGGGARNLRGIYYEAHDHSFEGFDEEKVVGKPKPGREPAYASAWKVDMPAGTSRLAAADVTGDGAPRLLAVAGGTLTVYRLAGGSLQKEGTVELGEHAGEMAAGKFAKDRPAVIALPGAYVFREGEQYVRKPTPLAEFTGTVLYKDGVAEIFSFSGESVETWTINPGAAKPLSPGRKLVPPEQGSGVYTEMRATLPAPLLEQLHIPEEGRKPGVLGYVDPRNEGKLFTWLPWHDGFGWFLVLARDDLIHAGADPGELKPAWKSPKLAGDILDVALTLDPKGSKKPGFLLLEATGPDAKGRTAEFFALE